MTVKYINTADNLKAVLAAQNTYFIVERAITLQAIQYTLGKGSVIEFTGGSFKGIAGTSFNLNGGQVIADPYPIFSNMAVSGFSNSKVYAEWFNSNGDTAPHTYINNALKYAKGCPVVLTKMNYQLKGTITFPTGTPSTLICAGTLEVVNGTNTEWNNNPVAIEIDVSNVRLDIYRIKFQGKEVKVIDNKTGLPLRDENDEIVFTTVPDKGTGIRISGDVYHVSVYVNTILYPELGIDITPGKVGASANVQYLNIKFQYIYAEYCIYMNIFSVGDTEKNRITRCSFHGGRLSGSHGIYMTDGIVKSAKITESCFTNIGFESLDKSAITLRNATRLRFEYIRMAESLPKGNNPWIDFKNVSYASFTINGDLNADKYVASGSCSDIVIKGSVLKTTSWRGTPFDMIVIDPNDGTPQKAATCSVSPYQMTNTVTRSSNLQEIQPTIMPAVTGKFGGLKALPRILQFNNSSAATVNLQGLPDYAPCLFYLTKTGKNTLEFVPSNTSANITEAGAYQMVWIGEQGNLKLMAISLKK